MQLFNRDSATSGFNVIASSLSLAVANYKPIPQLPTTSELASTSDSSANQLKVSGGRQQTFQTQPLSGTSLSTAKNVSEWGEVSLLYVPKETPTSRVAAAGSTIGPGKCQVLGEYTPTGGWDALPPPTFGEFDPVQANIYRYRQQQGVNLGAWFIKEAWMQSSLFDCATGASSAEIDILTGFGNTSAGIGNATAYMEQIWDTWITEADFKKMASMGINTVRLPIGFFSAGPYFAKKSATYEPYADVYYYSWRYVARAINWAAKYDIGVLVDLHGAYGSQNGQDHSGYSSGKIDFFNSKNMGLTSDLLVWMTGQLANVTNLVGIQLLNEPVNRDSLWPWYYTTMDTMRKVSSSVPLYFHDAFNGAQGAAFVANRTDFVVQDHHSYYVYTDSDVAESAKGHITDINGNIQDTYQQQSNIARRNLVQGEWSCALAPNSISQAKNQSFAQTNFCTDQASVYRKTSSGFMFWSWKMQSCSSNSGWCFQQAVKTFLPATFDSWGLISKTAAFINLDTTASSGLTTLESQIGSISLPTESTTLDTKTRAALSKVTKITSIARVGLVENKNQKRSQTVWTAGGSFASRANKLIQIEKRSTSTSVYASAAGWSDGFLSAQIFASEGKLSRIGFARQYQEDTFNIRRGLGEVVKSDASAYNTTFISGILAAENLIAQSISTFSN